MINFIIGNCRNWHRRNIRLDTTGWQGDPLGVFKKFKFDHTNKWYMQNPASVLENETHKLLWDFEMQTDHQISARRPDLIIIKKKKKKKKDLQKCGLCCPANHRIKIKASEKKDKYIDLAKDLKKKDGTWKWQLYQSGLVLLVQSPKNY